MTKYTKQLRFSLMVFSTGLLLNACSHTPSQTALTAPYFLGAVQVTSNVSNLCTATHMLYGFRVDQSWLAGGSGLTWYGCTAERQTNLQPEYMLTYSIIKNDGAGTNIVSKCTNIPQGLGPRYSKMNVVVKLSSTTPTCQAILSE